MPFRDALPCNKITAHGHPSDSDARWNSTQHPTWPQALSEDFTPAVNDSRMGLRCFDSLRSGWTAEFDVRGNGLMLGGKFPNTMGMLGGNLGDAGWKLYREERKRPKYLNWEFANIIYYNNSASRNQVVPFIHWDTFQHTRFSCEFLQTLQLIPKYPIDIKKLKERCKDIYALTIAMDLRCSRRSDQKNDDVFFFYMI